jgi:hypothetical protein
MMYNEHFQEYFWMDPYELHCYKYLISMLTFELNHKLV